MSSHSVLTRRTPKLLIGGRQRMIASSSSVVLRTVWHAADDFAADMTFGFAYLGKMSVVLIHD